MNNNNRTCLNCGATLQGKFCHACGQEIVNLKVSFSDLVRDYLGDTFTYDSRFYRTMVPLLIRPGFLTSEYFKGRRVRYVPPLRLYLFISFLLFLWFATVDTDLVNLGDPGNINIDFSQELNDSDTQAFANDEIEQWEMNLEAQIERIAQNPSAFWNLAESRLPYLMFLLMPVFAAVLWLHYCRSGYGYLQHLIFTLHSQSFIYALIFLVTFINLFLPLNYSRLTGLLIIIYFTIGLRNVYGSSWVGANIKALSVLLLFSAILIFAFIGFLFVQIMVFS